MDPNATLEELRQLSAQLNGDIEEGSESNIEDYEKFVSLFDALDVWLTQKGFKPDDWK